MPRAIFIAVDGAAGRRSLDSLAATLGPLIGALHGRPALLSRIEDVGSKAVLLFLPWRRRGAHGSLGDGLSFFVDEFAPEAYAWSGPGQEEALRLGLNLQKLPPPPLPDEWREHLVYVDATRTKV